MDRFDDLDPSRVRDPSIQEIEFPFEPQSKQESKEHSNFTKFKWNDDETDSEEDSSPPIKHTLSN
jgi:hypothetical protein